MDARILRALAVVAAACLSLGASWRTENFIVEAPTQALAREFCETAENCRQELAREWLGKELPRWPSPCPVRIDVGPHLGAGGATSFYFDDHGRPYGWTMSIQGSRERLIDSVIPHEVTHTIFATHFGQPLPRWADEGACTTVEADEEKDKHKKLLIRFLTTGQGIAFNRMFAMKNYPDNILPLYSQGYSVARYLIAQSGKQKYVQFVGDGMRSNNWPEAVRQHYGFADLSDLQVTWLEWVRQGSPALEQAPQLAGAHFRQALSAQVSAVQQASATFDTAEARAAAPAQSAAPVQPAVPVQPVALQSAAPRSDDGGLMPVSPSSGTPLAQSNAPSAGGWYSQQRDLRAAQSDGEGSAVAATSNTNSIASQAKGVEERLAVAATNPAPYRPGSIGRESAVHQSLARQQPIGRPGQTVLEPGMGYAPAQPPTVMRR